MLFRSSTVNGVVGECNDGYLNDIRGRHVRPEHVFQALASATSGPVEEGCVGGGTGMSCLGFKGGIGTASRRITSNHGIYHLGALVRANFGSLESLTIAGVPVGLELVHEQQDDGPGDGGSIMMVVATDAPLDARQIRRVARRATIGLGRTGSYASHGSGDYVFAFTTANQEDHFGRASTLRQDTLMRDDDRVMGRLFQAAAETIEEAIINALFKAETTVGRDGNARQALPLQEVSVILTRYWRLCQTHV